MPTIQEIIAKRAELQKTNPNATNVDARKALMPTTTPTTPVAPPTTPTPTVTWVNGEQFVQAPVDPNTGLSTPTQSVTAKAPEPTKTEVAGITTPTTTPEVKPTELTPFQKAQIESEKIKAQNEAKMKENEQKAQLESKKAQETTQASIPTNQKDILASLIGGISVPKQNTLAYRNANKQYEEYQRFAWMTSTQLLDNLKQWQVSSTMSNLLASNPAFQQAKQQYDKVIRTNNINRTMTEIGNWMTGKVEAPVDYFQELSDKILKQLGISDMTTEEAFTTYVKEDKDVLNYTQQLSSVNSQLAESRQLLSDAIKSEKAIKGDMPANVLAVNLVNKFSELTDTINALENSKTSIQADLTNAMNMANANFTAVSQDINNARNIRNSVISQAIQSQFNLATAKSEAELAKQIAEEARNDPATAIASIIQEYANLGIPSSIGALTHIQAFENSGKSLEEYTKKMIEDYQSKPEYKAKYGVQPATVDTKPFKVGDQTYQLNPSTGQYEVINPITAWTGGDLRYLANQFPWQAWAKNNNPAGITWNANFDKWTGTAKLLADAGINYSKGTARPANEGGNYVTFDTIEDGLKAQQIIMSQTYWNSTVGQMLASWVGTGEGANYAKQVAGMAWVDTNAKVSSLTPEQLSTLQMAKIKKESPWLYNILSQGQWAGTGVSSDAQNWFNLIQKWTTSYEDVMKKLGGTKIGQWVLQEINSLISQNGGAIPALPDSPQVKQMDKLIDVAKSLTPSAIENLSWFFQTSPWDAMTGKNDDTRSAIEFLVKWQTLQQLIDAKAQGATFGALSNEELKMLQNSASRLTAMIEFDEQGKVKNFKGTEKSVKAELADFLKILEEKRNKMLNPWGLQPQNTGAGQTNQVTWKQTYSW